MIKEFTTTSDRIKGKLCHFGKKELCRHGLEDYYWKSVEDVDFETLRDKVYNILLKEKFVFFNAKPEYKYITEFGKLSVFMIQFWHIE